eukprot:6317726-Pyramimonas_sp.AAC.1
MSAHNLPNALRGEDTTQLVLIKLRRVLVAESVREVVGTHVPIHHVLWGYHSLVVVKSGQTVTSIQRPEDFARLCTSVPAYL